jgi:hypothetical protein
MKHEEIPADRNGSSMRTDGQTETDRNTEVNKEFNSHFSQTFF